MWRAETRTFWVSYHQPPWTVLWIPEFSIWPESHAESKYEKRSWNSRCKSKSWRFTVLNSKVRIRYSRLIRQKYTVHQQTVYVAVWPDSLLLHSSVRRKNLWSNDPNCTFAVFFSGFWKVQDNCLFRISDYRYLKIWKLISSVLGSLKLRYFFWCPYDGSLSSAQIGWLGCKSLFCGDRLILTALYEPYWVVSLSIA